MDLIFTVIILTPAELNNPFFWLNNPQLMRAFDLINVLVC